MARTGRTSRSASATAFVVALMLALLASMSFEMAHAAKIGPPAALGETVAAAPHEDGSGPSSGLHVGHCTAHCASHALNPMAPVEGSSALPGAHASWLALPADAPFGVSPNLEDQPPRG